MVNRIMMRQRFKQWVGSTEYIVSVEDGAGMAGKIMQKRKLRNNFNKYLAKVKELKRLEHVEKKTAWFTQTRAGTSKVDVFQSWMLFVKRHKMAKKFLMRSSNTLDKQLINEGFAKWKGMVSKKRQKLYMDNIQELERRKDEHEESIKKFRKDIEKNESK